MQRPVGVKKPADAEENCEVGGWTIIVGWDQRARTMYSWSRMPAHHYRVESAFWWACVATRSGPTLRSRASLLKSRNSIYERIPHLESMLQDRDCPLATHGLFTSGSSHGFWASFTFS